MALPGHVFWLVGAKCTDRRMLTKASRMPPINYLHLYNYTNRDMHLFRSRVPTAAPYFVDATPGVNTFMDTGTRVLVG